MKRMMITLWFEWLDEMLPFLLIAFAGVYHGIFVTALNLVQGTPCLCCRTAPRLGGTLQPRGSL